jgi:uncharacterized protein YjbI with pentapeptide repeats
MFGSKFRGVFVMKLKISMVLAAIAFPCVAGGAWAFDEAQLKQLTETKQCNGCDLSEADLANLDLEGAQLVGANLNAANLANANLRGANLTKASIVEANLANTNLRQTTLRETTFVYSNLAQVTMQGATLYGTDFQGANLNGLNLSDAKIEHTSFTNANLAGLKLPKTVKVLTDRAFDANSNTFTRSTLYGLDGNGEIERRITSDGVTTTYELGGSARRARLYKIPAWIGKVQRSTAMATRVVENVDRPNRAIK